MIDQFIKFVLIFLIVFTPIAFGSMELWAFSLMELGILLMVILVTVQSLGRSSPDIFPSDSSTRIPRLTIPLVFLGLFLLFVLFQLLPLPSSVIKIISPNTFKLRESLSIADLQVSLMGGRGSLSFVPFGTEIEFLKWLALGGLFFALLRWGLREGTHFVTHAMIVVMILIGVTEALYGLFEFFSGHRYILYLDRSSTMTAVTGTFINRNYFAGYLLLVIPTSVGFLVARQARRPGGKYGWRHRLSSVDGKSLLIGYAIIIMILALLFSSSRMGITSLLISLTLMLLLFRDPKRGERFFRISFLIPAMAFVWAAWIGLDAVISRFFSPAEDFHQRWMVWTDTFRILKDFPLFGSGLGTFLHIFPMYQSFHIEGIFTHAENDFLQLASDVGLVGIGLLSVIFFYLFLRGILGIRSLSPRNPEKYVGMGGLVGTLALLFHSTVERNIQVPANAFLFTFLLAMVLTISHRGQSYRETGQKAAPNGQ